MPSLKVLKTENNEVNIQKKSKEKKRIVSEMENGKKLLKTLSEHCQSTTAKSAAPTLAKNAVFFVQTQRTF